MKNKTTTENKENLEAVLAIAVNTVMGNYDSYSGSKAHNYYLLYSNGKFTYIGWDYNMSIGGFSEDNGASIAVDISSPVYNVDISQRPLIGKLLAIDEYMEQYLGYVDSLTNYFADFEKTLSEIAASIRADVEKDLSTFYTAAEFESNIIASGTDLSQVQNTPNFGKGGNIPDMGQLPSGEVPNVRLQPGYDLQGSGQQRPNGNGIGGMINSKAVSIVDYIVQRIANIKAQ